MEKNIDIEITVIPTGKVDKAVALDMALVDNPDFIIPQGGDDVNTKPRDNNGSGKKSGDEIHVPQL